MFSASDVKNLREATGVGMMDCKKALEASNGDMDKAIEYLRENGLAKAAKKSGRIAAEGLTAVKSLNNKVVMIEINSETDFVSKNDEFKSLVETILDTILNSDAASLEEALNLTTSEGVTIEQLIVDKTVKIGEKLSFRRMEVATAAANASIGIYIHMGGKISSFVVIDGVSEEVSKDVAMHIAALSPRYLNKDEVPEDVISKEREILTEQAKNEGLDEAKLPMIVEGRINKFCKEICLEDQLFIKGDKQTVLAYVKQNGGVISSWGRYEVGEGIEKKNEDFAEEVRKQIEG